MPTSSLFSTVRDLAALAGPSGHERDVALAFAKELRGVTDDITLDPFGNVIAAIRGEGARGAVMVSAHLDEVGLVVKHVEADGVLRVDLNGLIDERVLLASPVDIWTRGGSRAGIVGARSRHHLSPEELARPLATAELWLEVGADTAADVAALGIRVGDLVTFAPNFRELGGGYIASKALDNRAGLAVVLEAVRRLPARLDVHLYVVGTAQEEVGARGARVAAQTLAPAIAVSVDTVAGGEPGLAAARANARIGGGPVIRAWEWMAGTMTGAAYHRGLVHRLVDTAEAAGITYQLDVARTWTDACGIATTGQGVPMAGLYIPRRGAHSPCEVAKLSDLEEAARLLTAFLGGLSGRDVVELGSPARL